MRYFLNISYRGAKYHGWQTQPNDVSVQQTIESALTTLLHTPTAILGAGRTDAGVNARMTVAHFDGPDMDRSQLVGLMRSLNAICRMDITVNDIVPVAPDANARFDATCRTYRYFVHTTPDPFIYPLSLLVPPLDFGAMNTAARHLLGTQDFTSLAKLHSDTKTNICTVYSAGWHRIDDSTRWYFQVSANRFLRNMVRAMVGTLVQVGKGQIAPDDVASILARRDRCQAGMSMPGHPLFLWDVNYPYYNPLPQTNQQIQ